MDKHPMTFRYRLLVALIFLAPMSFFPSFALPLFNFPSFRVGLYQVLAVAFVTLCLPEIIRYSRQFLKHHTFLITTSLLALTLVIGLATSFVPDRTALYSASLVFLLLLGVGSFIAWKELSKEQREVAKEALLWSGLGFSILGLIQLAVASFDRTALGTLCTGCSDAVFGFPRINLFAAEPQFFANSLLPALFASIFFRKNARLANAVLILSATTIGLTFSRGAFLALGAGFITLVSMSLYKKTSVSPVLKAVATVLAGILIAFGLLVTSASIRYQHTPFIAYNTAVSMLDHLSLGKINLPQKTIQVVQPQSPVPQSSFKPEGFVEASSNDRLSAADLALNAWNDSPKTLLFGVGMGNLGAYVTRYVDPTAHPLLTVYIWYVLVVAELGIIGLACLLLPIFYLFSRIIRARAQATLFFIAATTVAFLVHLMTFGSYINIMYIYIFIGIALAITSTKSALRT